MSGKKFKKLRKLARTVSEAKMLSSSNTYSQADAKRVLSNPVTGKPYAVVNGQVVLTECERKIYQSIKGMRLWES